MCVWGHDMSYPSEKAASDLGEHAQSCSSATKNISPLPQCQWPPNLAWWGLNTKAFQPIHMIYSPGITWQAKLYISTAPTLITTKLVIQSCDFMRILYGQMSYFLFLLHSSSYEFIVDNWRFCLQNEKRKGSIKWQ